MPTKTNSILENLLVWSAHRSRTVGLCERKYYYNYIGSWEGWDTNAPDEIQEAYRLKHLTTIDLEVGQIIHGQICTLFEKALAGGSINPGTEIRNAQEKLKTFLQCSVLRRLEDLTSKRRKLFVHEVGGSIDREEVSGCLDKIEAQLNEFFQLADVKNILADPSVLLREFLDPLNFEVTNELAVPARLRTDAVYLSTDRLVICDWKCGSSMRDGAPNEEHRLQGLVYDIYVRGRLSLRADDPVEVRFYYLGTGQVVAYSFSEDDRAEMLWAVGEQFQTLRTYSEDSRLNVGREERFRACVSRACLGCNHRLMCPEFQGSKLNGGKHFVP